MRKSYCLLFIICCFLFIAGNATIAAEETESSQQPVLKADETTRLSADNAPAKEAALGSTDPKSGFKFRLDLTSKGAAIARAVFSEFDNRDYKNPQPLQILSPVHLRGGGDIYPMANADFVFIEQQLKLALDKLHWQLSDVETDTEGMQQATFETIIKDQTDTPVLKLRKTYKVVLDSYLLSCNLAVENLTQSELKVSYNLTGPVGLGREDVRSDARKAVAAFRDPKGQITSMRLDIKKLYKARTIEDRRLKKPGAEFLWAAATNKYFTAILVPQPDEGKTFCDWAADRTGWYYNPDEDKGGDTGDEAIGISLQTAPAALAPAGEQNSTRTYNFQLYIGPKDKSLFDKNELYRNLGFFHTIDFLPCFCCPSAIINPLAFAILAAMKWMYGFIPNYGIVIIILVFVIRIVIHPLTKKSQVSMSKMGELGPKAEEIRQKYAKDKVEQNKQLMALYKERGFSPITGMLPMLVQMPIWIALYSAIYASIELRGASFLPFWITDLSVPDAVYRFPQTIVIPLLGWKVSSVNLLPILMGAAFYFQQKLMPSPQTAAATNPQVAQQQKIMMIMMPFLFPLMLYNGPSGLNLYIMASTFAGVIEQHIIRKHIRQKQEEQSQGVVAATSKTGGKAKKKKPKPFFRM
jgi:YidC/Oxa1 family membrane protein insertase